MRSRKISFATEERSSCFLPLLSPPPSDFFFLSLFFCFRMHVLFWGRRGIHRRSAKIVQELRRLLMSYRKLDPSVVKGPPTGSELEKGEVQDQSPSTTTTDEKPQHRPSSPPRTYTSSSLLSTTMTKGEHPCEFAVVLGWRREPKGSNGRALLFALPRCR